MGQVAIEASKRPDAVAIGLSSVVAPVRQGSRNFSLTSISNFATIRAFVVIKRKGVGTYYCLDFFLYATPVIPQLPIESPSSPLASRVEADRGDHMPKV